jgi:hypothetical protein
MGDVTNAYSILVGKPERKNHLKGISVDESIILELILGKYRGMVWTKFIWIRIGTSGGIL